MSDYKEIHPGGLKINVCVEGVFEEGMVVCYTDDQTGNEYRGALLSLTPLSPDQRLFLQPARRKLANPLAYVHDHPYSDLTKYAKHVSKIPSDVVLNWSTFPTTAPVTETCNLKEIASRRQLANVPLHVGPDDMQLSKPQIRRGIVYINPVRERHFHQNIIPSGTGRTAKMVAYSRMFGPYEDTFEKDAGLHFNHKQNRLPRFKKKGTKVRAKAKVSSLTASVTPKPRTKQPRFKDRSKTKVSSLTASVSPKPRTKQPRFRDRSEANSVSPKLRTKQPRFRDRSEADSVSPKPRTKQPRFRDGAKAKVSISQAASVSPKMKQLGSRDRSEATLQAASVSPKMKQLSPRDRSKVQVSTLSISQVSPKMKQPSPRDGSKVQVPISQAASVSPKMKQPSPRDRSKVQVPISQAASVFPKMKQLSPRDRSKVQVSTLPISQAASVSPKMKQLSLRDRSKVQVSTLPISQAASVSPKMKPVLHTTSVSPGSGMETRSKLLVSIPSSVSPEPKPRVCLKNFSIPLVPINIHFVRVSVSSSTGISPSPPPESLSSDETVFSSQSIASDASPSSSVSSPNSNASFVSSISSSVSSHSSTPSVPYIVIVD